jgi:hypothetical protein
VPSLTLYRKDNLSVHEKFRRSQAPAYLVEIANTTHFNYFDFTIMSPLYKGMGVLGTIGGEEMVGIQRDFVTAFFDTYLKASRSPLLEGDEKHASANITLQKR